MSDQWYYQAFGQEFGPLAEEEMARMLVTGELTPEDEVREGAEGPWKKARSVAGLMEAVTAVAVQTAEVATDIDSFLLVDEQEIASTSRSGESAPDSDFDLSAEVAHARDELEVIRLDEADEPESPELPADEPAIWYFQTFGTELGPVPLSELMNLVDRGELGASDAIRMGADGEWITAGEIPELFPMGQTTPRPPTYSRPPSVAAQSTTSNWKSPASAPSQQPPPGSQSAPPSRPAAEQAWNVPRMQPAGAAPQAWTAPDASVDVNWYCYLNEQELGPMAVTELQGMAVAGQVTAEVYVKYGANGEWVLASQVPNLLPSDEPAPASASQVVFVPVAPATPAAAAPATAPISLADTERNELVHQLLDLLKKEGLQNSLMGSINTAAPVTGTGWYCNISGSVMGPVSIQALVQMVLQKRIFPDDLIRLGDSGEWFPASTFPDLFPDSSPKGKKGLVEDELSVMARIDQMYQEAQEAKAKQEAAEAANPNAKVGSNPSKNKFNANMLHDINAKMARGKTDAELAAERQARREEFYGSLKLDRRNIMILVAVAVVGLGYLSMPYLLQNIIAGQGYEALLKIQTAVEKDKDKPLDAATEKKLKEVIKQIDGIARSVKGGATKSAKRDVARMANYMKEMVRSIGKKPAANAGPNAVDDFTRAQKHFEEYKKAAATKLGKKGGATKDAKKK